MEISVFETDRDAHVIRRALVAEGHNVVGVAREKELRSCDLVVLDGATWSPAAVDRIAARLPHAELLLLVDDPKAKPPNDSVMTLVKPVDVNKLIRLVRVVAEARHGRSTSRDLVDFETLFSGDSPAMVELLRRVGLLAQSDAPVWLHGELGTGRAVVARAIHDRSARQGRMFMAVNAASFPGDLLEEHLFGGVEPQVLRVDSGTLFIDSVTELAPGVQAKLLRLLEDQRLRVRDRDLPLDARIMVGDERRTLNVGGRLRRELHQLLKVHELDLPPLRERAGDLGAIIKRMLERLRTGGDASPLSTGAIKSLAAYPFPGNIRELAHALTHAVVLSQGGQIQVEHLPVDIQEQTRDALAPAVNDPDALETLEAVATRFERDYLLRVLRAVGGNRTRAAKILNVSRKGLWQKLKAHGIAPSEGRPDAEDEVDAV
ncbi:MAG TPA: sigma 54-interacting transcriptional regulator [Kofleriaceae bacterium]|nr:sigma 54-interacting transcriptional regulator [Kofleriaceae bacterium]